MDDLTDDMVEDFIDKHGVVRLLAMLARICHEKAEHVEANWQDRSLAAAWRKGARVVEKACAYDWPL